MPYPIILGFESGSSLATLDAITVGVGRTWGSVTMPFTPLLFTPERIANALGPRNAYANGRSLDTRQFYDDTYSNLPMFYKRRFWGNSVNITRQVQGVTMGISGGGILGAAAKAIEQALVETVLKRILKSLLSSVSADALQASTSIDATLYGMNGRDTYNLDLSEFNEGTNIFFINAGIGCITQVAVNLVFIGNFPSRPLIGNPMDIPRIISSVYSQATAWTIVGDGAAGLIMPGGAIALISS